MDSHRLFSSFQTLKTWLHPRLQGVPQASKAGGTRRNFLDVANALNKVLHVLLHPGLLRLLSQQCSLQPVNFCLKFLYCPLSHLCIDLSISESLLDILDLLLKIFFSLSILIALIRKTFHGLVHPSQLGLQHGNLSITPGCPLLCSVLMVLSKTQFANNLLTLGIRFLSNSLCLCNLALQELNLVASALVLGLHMLSAIVGLSKMIRSALQL